MVSKISNALTSRKFRLMTIKLGIIACTIAMAMCNAMFTFAAITGAVFAVSFAIEALVKQ